VGAGFGVSRATAYRYRDEAIDVLDATTPDLHEALEQAGSGEPAEEQGDPTERTTLPLLTLACTVIKVRRLNKTEL
jgi:hypothetical protein